jgi:hypothetical protein
MNIASLISFDSLALVIVGLYMVHLALQATLIELSDSFVQPTEGKIWR